MINLITIRYYTASHHQDVYVTHTTARLTAELAHSLLQAAHIDYEDVLSVDMAPSNY